MKTDLDIFEQFSRVAGSLSSSEELVYDQSHLHPFDAMNIHPDIANIAGRLFDDGHYSQATFESYKFVDKQVARISGLSKSGARLMLECFKEVDPVIQLTPLNSISEVDEQKGYGFLFAGSIMAIRNPRGHEVGNIDSLDQCLDHLTLASLLLRRLGERIKP